MLKALADGSLDENRWNSYLKLKTENMYNSNEAEYLQAKREKFKAIAKMKRKK